MIAETARHNSSRRVGAWSLAMFLAVGCGPQAADVSEISEEETGRSAEVVPITRGSFEVTHNDLRMQVRETYREDETATRVLVLLPSATYSTRPNWDLQIGELSVMDAFARSGWHVIAVDLPGYGDSDDPPEQQAFGAEAAEPFLHAVVESVVEQHQVAAVDLLGWSWGAQVAGVYAQEHPDRVRRLVLYGFTVAMRIPEEVFPEGYLEQPFRELTREHALSDFVEGCHDPRVAEAYADACLAADDRVPTGPLNDYVHHLPLVNPERLTMPCLVISGQYEVDAPPGRESEGEHFLVRKWELEMFEQNLATETSAFVVIPGGGHAVHLETPAADWRRSVLEFLDRH